MKTIVTAVVCALASVAAIHEYDYESIYEIGIIIDTPYQKQEIGYEVLSALIKRHMKSVRARQSPCSYL